MSEISKPHSEFVEDSRTLILRLWNEHKLNRGDRACLENLVEQFEVLREFFIAHWEVEQGITDFDLHAEAVERLRAAMEPAYRVSFP